MNAKGVRSAGSRPKTCLVAAPYGIRLNDIRRTLVEFGVKASSVVTDDSEDLAAWQAAIGKADFLLAIWGENQTEFVSFLTGVAVGKSKPVFLVVESGAIVPFMFEGLPTVTTQLYDLETIKFHLGAFIQAFAPIPSYIRSAAIPKAKNLPEPSYEGAITTQHLRGRDLENVIRNAFLHANFRVTTETKSTHDSEPDVTVWHPDFPIGDLNPLVIEVSINPKDRLVVDALAAKTKKIASALLLIHTGSQEGLTLHLQSQVLVFETSSDFIFKHLVSGTLMAALRDQRNQFMHRGT